MLLKKNLKQSIIKIQSLVLLATFVVGAQSRAHSEAKLIYRFEQQIEYPHDYDVTTKAVERLSKYVTAENANDRVAMRICSKDSLLRAFYTAAGNPWEIWGHMVTGWLAGWDKVSPERTLILRSADCLGSDVNVSPMELWALPASAPPPTFVESMKFCQLSFDHLAGNQLKGVRPHLVKQREFESALLKLIARLRADPKALGLVWGYFLRERTAIIEQRLKDAHLFMERCGISQDRYVVRLSQFGGDFHSSTPEPNYPDVDVVHLLKVCKRQ